MPRDRLYFACLTRKPLPCLCVSIVFVLPLLTGDCCGQFSLPAIDSLPNAPATYQMRDWHQTAIDFDTLAFDTTATGQYLPLVRIDNTPESAQLQKAFGLPAYVGETRTFGENGEPVHEAIASLAAVLGGTFVGVDKSAGPNNWVSMAREYYVNRNGQYVVLNNPFASSGGSAWYDIYPNVLFYQIADRYPDETYLGPIMDQIDQRFYDAVGVLTANGAAPNFNHTAYNFRTRQPVDNGVWREPDMGLGMAWMQHAAYWRNQDSNPGLAAQHLTAVDWALSYYEQTSANPDYEILAPFGAYTAARMNAEHERNYDIEKFVNWVFDRSDARPTKIMISGEQWGGEEVGGLMGFTIPNIGDVRGYAFSMNTFATAMPMVPLARYEDRYSQAIGKWMVNVASAARLFYGDAHSNQNQSSEFWTGDPNSAVSYEGLRHHWLGGEFDGEELYAAGDPLTYNWGPETNFAIYGSAMAGVFGSIIKTTNVEKILQLDLLATDSFRGAAHPTYLYYNPLANTQSVAIDLGAGAFDLYDAVANRFLARSVSGQQMFDVSAGEAVQLVLVPAGGIENRQGRRLLVNDVVIDYNASLLANNLIRNGDVDERISPGTARPAFWHYSSGAKWSAEVALSPTHSLEIVDNSQTKSEEWRSYATDIPAGEERFLQLRWFWKFDVAAGEEFQARLRLSDDLVTSLDLTNPLLEFNFVATGSAIDFEMFETMIELPDGVSSFDLTFISGGSANATGTMFIDDISANLVEIIPGDFNGDGFVDGADFLKWQRNPGVGNLADWQANFGAPPLTASSIIASSEVPEPTSFMLATCIAVGLFVSRITC
ncbi:hypothetical protein [Bythopirellula polymerisocia]|uniref:Uncharacterized protein n=1 Tax=Bythopirellula polymerisocia TaxID=2528003 RepID=A0A5C6CTR5_9BACT|nr:hypothetical protein [Bythopirellula polymerisocia]TWU28343.1 hypothetical protein Pla144_16310 [Bythopirellula polymerisocia]